MGAHEKKRYRPPDHGPLPRVRVSGPERVHHSGEDGEVRQRFAGVYPGDWPELAAKAKARAGNKCERCGHGNHAASGHVLTVHHLDGDKGNSADWNLGVLCQRCHLRIQGKVNMFQGYMFEHTPWMQWHVDGFLKARLHDYTP